MTMKFVENFEIETTKNLAESLNELRIITNKIIFHFLVYMKKQCFAEKFLKQILK